MLYEHLLKNYNLHWKGPLKLDNTQQMVFDFHKKYGCMINTQPTVPDAATLLLRSSLHHEESTEFDTAARTGSLVGMVDALCDLIYVVNGTAVVLGVDLEPIFRNIHNSNMTKDGGGKDSGGKILKGPNYVPPDVKSLLKEQGFAG